MKPATLCVIDIQYFFGAARNPSLLNNVVALIEAAKAKRAGIVVLEYKGCGSSSVEVQKSLYDYDRCVFTTKTMCDGSQEFISACKFKRLNTKKIVVCGVETDVCVYETITGLHLLLPKSKIEVVASACNAWHDDDKKNKEVFKTLSNYKNVVIRR